MEYKCFNTSITVYDDVSAEKVNKIVENAFNTNSDCQAKVRTVQTVEMTKELADELADRRIKAGDILVSKSKSADVKLFEIFNMYKEDLRKFPQFYYAMLEWKDAHYEELKENGCLGVIPDYMQENAKDNDV